MPHPTSYRGEVNRGAGGDYLTAIPVYGDENPTPPRVPTPPVIQTPRVSSSVITSTPAANQVNQSAEYLQRQQGIRDQISVLQKELDKKLADEKAKKDAKDAKNKKIDSLSDIKDTSSNPLFVKYQKDTEKQMRELDRVQSRVSGASSSLIDSIRRNYESVINDQKQANDAYEGGITTAGLVSGRNQYAPEFQANLIGRAVNSGIKKIEEYQNQRDQLIAEAELAMEEGNYAHVVKKMELIRKNYEDEVQSAKDLALQTKAIADAERQRIKDERETYDYNSEQVAPLLLDQLSGNEESDNAIISDYADDMGVPFFNLYGAVNKARQENQKALPSEINEYQTAKRLGYIPANMTLYQYRQSKFKPDAPSTPKKKLTSFSTAASLGSTGLEGIEEDEIRASIVDRNGKINDKPPTWFIENIKSQVGDAATPVKIQEAWDAAKTDEDLLNFVYGKGNNQDEGGGF